LRKLPNTAPSLRRRLMLILLSLIVSAWAVTATTSYFKTKQEVETLFDAQLSQVAFTLNEIAVNEYTLYNLNKLQQVLKQQSTATSINNKIAFQIWYQDKLIIYSNNAPTSKISNREGFDRAITKDVEWRVFTLVNNDLLIEVAEGMEVREQLINAIVNDIILPMLFILPAIALMIWIGISTSLAPLNILASAVSKRSAQQLDPIDIKNAPQELLPLVNELNDLLVKLDEAFTMEQHFASYASHELRTPLAVIKTQAQVAIRSNNHKEKEDNLKKIVGGVDRATHMVSQLLNFVRIETVTMRQPLNLMQVVLSVVTEHTPIALKKKIDLSLSGQKELTINGYYEGLQLMLTNLIDNAIRYTPEGGKVLVDISQKGTSTVLTIRDNGPGISDGHRHKVFERFYRIPGTTSPGCGIGLSIVKRVVELNNAKITLNTPQKGSGLIVKLVFN